MACRFASLIFAATGLWQGVAIHTSEYEEYDRFRQKYRPYPLTEDKVDYNERFALFKENKAKIEEHNAQPGVSFQHAVNKFADWTEAEKKAQLGYKRVRLTKTQEALKSQSLVDTAATPPKEIAKSKDWTVHAATTGAWVKDQGNCGSCWAVSSVGALEMYNEIKFNVTRSLSWGELVDCVPNPGVCGGQGGCDGATAELAFGYVAGQGLSYSDSYLGKGRSHSVGANPTACNPGTTGMPSGGQYVQLPTNQQAPLMAALSNVGPVVVSVDASNWNFYHSGIMGADRNGCGTADKKLVTVNHAVLAVGYGTDHKSGKNYWLIRNSWGSDWGENGFIRVERTDHDDSWCGTDSDPLVGVGCVGNAKYNISASPPTLPVCGMCGILSDSSYPIPGAAPTSLAQEVEVNPSGNVMMRSEPK